MKFTDKFVCAGEKYNTYAEHVPAPYMRKKFTLDKKPSSAEICVCALGFYELHVNGRNVTKGLFAPYISNPKQVRYYDVYDVAKYLVAGENVVGIILGNGGQNSDVPTWGYEKLSFRSAPKLALELTVDGKSMFEADEMKTYPSPITFDDFRAGECYDARNEVPGWDRARFDDGGWKDVIETDGYDGKKLLCAAAPTVKTGKKSPLSVTKTGRGTFVYDFGEDLAGLVRMKINGRLGQHIHAIMGEGLSSDGVIMCNLLNGRTDPNYIQMFDYICKEGDQEYEQKFTFYGFRFVEISGIDDEQATLDALTMITISSSGKRTADFASSNIVLNRLFDCVRSADESNLVIMPIDDPHREKQPWANDITCSCDQFLSLYDCAPVLREYVRAYALSIRADGDLPGIIPVEEWGYTGGVGLNGPMSSMALIEIPYMLYKYTGDLGCFLDVEEALLRHFKYLRDDKLNEDGVICYGINADWAENGQNYKQGFKFSTPTAVGDTLITMRMLVEAETLYKIAKMPDKAKYCAEFYAQLKAAFTAKYTDKERCCVLPSSQTAQALAMEIGIFDGEEAMRVAAQRLAELFHEHGDHMQMGPLGERLAYRMLSKTGYADLAYKAIVTPVFPSYGYLVTRGYTALWEYYIERPDSDAIAPYIWAPGHKLFGSFNHHFRGDVACWMLGCVGGIEVNPTLTDPMSAVIDPRFIRDLNFARVSRTLANGGKLTAEWRRTGKKIRLAVTVPTGAHVSLAPALAAKAGVAAARKEKPLPEGKTVFVFEA